MQISLRRLDFSNFYQLTRLSLQRPRLMYITWRTSKKTMHICQRKFENKHFKNGRENAYRHCLWCMLLQINTDTIDPDWASYFSEFYERLFPNSQSNSMMDLHNNWVGITTYKRVQPENDFQILRVCEWLMQRAKGFTPLELVKNAKDFPHHLVFIENEKIFN